MSLLNSTSHNSSSSSHVSLEMVDTWYWVIRGIIAILSIIGNGLVIYVIAFKRRLRVTANCFVLSLAVADFCVGFVATPSGLLCAFKMRCDWRLQITCYNFLLFASTLNLWAMAIDRYIAIVYSLRYKSLMTKRRVFIMIAMAWTFSAVPAFIRLLWLRNNSFDQRIDKYYRVLMDLFFVVISCVVLVTIYFRILHVSRKHARKAMRQLEQIHFNFAADIHISKARQRKSAKILGSVVLMFVLCYSLSIYISFCLIFKLNSGVNSLLITLSLLFVHLNSGVNFVVYALMKQDIRRELKCLSLCHRLKERYPADLTASREFSSMFK